ncbi:Signal peptide protein, partial [Globisporangium splendens]
MRDQNAVFWWITATFIAAVQWPFASRFVSAASDDCSNYVLAQDANVVLTWTLQSGVDAFTRISHTSEALLLPSSAGRVVVIGGIEYESAQPVVTNPLLVYNVDTNTFAKPQDSILSSLSPTTKTTSSRIVDDKFVSPASRADHASFITSANVVYLFGGQNTAFLNDTWRLCLDDSTATWDQLVAPSDAVTVAATPVPRIGHSFTQVFENATMIGAIVYGGISDAVFQSESGDHVAHAADDDSCSNSGQTSTAIVP